MQKILISSVFILSLIFYFGCQEPSPSDPTSGLYKKTPTWNVPGDFTTIQEAVDAASNGDIIRVASGNYAGVLLTKSVTIKGEGNVVIDDGPAHGSGLIQGFRMLAGSDGTTFSHLTFTTDLSIMNGEAVDNVTVTQCTFLNSVQAISDWRGDGWNIHHNTITDLRTNCGGGIGILVGDYSGGVVQDNVVSHNKISGTLHVAIDDCGGYDGSGIVLYADFRWGAPGADEIKNNYVTNNTISLVTDNPSAADVDVNAFELTDTRDDVDAVSYPVLFDNAIGFNDFRGTTNQILLTPMDLENHNDIDRNLGDNRGHGEHPSLFKP